MKRVLNKKEKRICERQLDRLNRDLRWLVSDLEYYDFQFTNRLEIAYERQLHAAKQAINEANAEIKNIKLKIEILSDQIENGVSIKCQPENTKEQKNTKEK